MHYLHKSFSLASGFDSVNMPIEPNPKFVPTEDARPNMPPLVGAPKGSPKVAGTIPKPNVALCTFWTLFVCISWFNSSSSKSKTNDYNRWKVWVEK